MREVSVVADVAALEREFLVATRPSALDVDSARTSLDALYAAGADSSLLVLFEAKLLAQTSPNRRDEALRTLIDHLRDTDNIAPRVAAQFCVMASKYATALYDVRSMSFVLSYANRLWTTYSDDSEVMRWRPAVEVNAGTLYVRINDLPRAKAHFAKMLRTYESTPDNFCWMTFVNVSLAIVNAREGNVAQARLHAISADSTGMPYDEDYRQLAWGAILLAEKRYDDAKACLRKAYRIAKENGKPDVVTDAQIALCRVYRNIGNLDAFWYAHERASDVAKENGLVHALDALSEIATGVQIT
jgi:tetratricopeptide (TPR) repeat protein